MASRTKIETARQLCLSKDTDFQAFLKGVNILEQLAVNTANTKEGRFLALKTLYEFEPDAGNDVLIRVCDMIAFLADDESSDCESEIFMISRLAIEGDFLDSHNRLLCPVCLFNNHLILESLNVFFELMKNPKIDPKYRVEACMYTIYSEDPRYREKTINILKDLVGDHSLSDDLRYREIVCKFNTTLGLNTILNSESLNVQYDEDLLHSLQTVYFEDEKNNVRYRILSGQHLLQMKCLGKNERENIGLKLLQIAESYNGGLEAQLTREDIDNIRADAADVVLRVGTDSQKEAARGIIQRLGYFDVQADSKRVALLTHRGIRTYVADAQNVHNRDINRAVNEFIVKLVEEYEGKELGSYRSIYTDVTAFIEKILATNPTDKLKAIKSLNRISIDTATFTDYEINSATIFIYLWTKIKKIEEENPEESLEIRKRFVEELVDMSDTCSTGHVGRLVNVLSGFGHGIEIKISFEEQLITNIGARMQARIKEISDEALREQIVCGMMEDAEPEDQDKFLDFITENISPLKRELYGEFVIPGYLSEKIFEENFKNTVNRWVGN